jgi:hypothetical protein
MKSKLSHLLLGCCLLAALSAAPAFGQFTITSMGSRSTVISGINDAGEIVGTLNNIGTFDDAGFLILPNSLPMSVGLLLTQTGTSSVDANGVNAAGKIVGDYTDSFGIHGYLRVGEKYTAIDFPGAVFTVANAINDSDVIVGYYYDGVTYHGFKDVAGTLTTLDESGARFTQAFGINNAGQVSGTYAGGDCTISACGFIELNGSFTQIVHPGAITTSVYGISNTGVVVGTYQPNAGFAHGFEKSGGVHEYRRRRLQWLNRSQGSELVGRTGRLFLARNPRNVRRKRGHGFCEEAVKKNGGARKPRHSSLTRNSLLIIRY